MQRQQDRLHVILLRVGHDPFDLEVLLIILEEVAGMKHDLLLLLLLEKLRKIRAQRLQDVLQRRNAGAGQVSFHLRKKAFGQFASRSELFQCQVIGRAQLSDLFSNIHSIPSCFVVLNFSFTKIKQEHYT